MILLLEKAFIHATTFKTKKGKVVNRKAYTDKRIAKKIVAKDRINIPSIKNKSPKEVGEKLHSEREELKAKLEEVRKHKADLVEAKAKGDTHTDKGIHVDNAHHIHEHEKNLHEKLETANHKLMLHENRYELQREKGEEAREKKRITVKKEADKKTEADKKETRSKAMIGNKNAEKFGSHEEYSNWLRKQSEYVKDNHKLDRIDGVLTATWYPEKAEPVKREEKEVVVKKEEPKEPRKPKEVVIKKQEPKKPEEVKPRETKEVVAPVPSKRLTPEEISKLPIDKQKKYFGEMGEDEYNDLRKMGQVVSATIDKMREEGEEKLKERSRKLDEKSRDLSKRKVRRNSNEYKKYSEATSKLYNDKSSYHAGTSSLKREGMLSLFPALRDVRGSAVSGFVDKYGQQHGQFIRDLQDAKIEIGLQNRRDYLIGDQKNWLTDKALATTPSEYAKKLGISEDVAKELPRAFAQHLLSKYSGSTFYSKPNTDFDELLTDYWQKNKAKHSGKGIEIQEDKFKPKITGNHHDYSDDDHSFLLPDITTKGFTKFTKLELAGEGHETVQRAAKEFEELKKSLIKSENLEREPSERFRDKMFKVDGGYQIVDGRIFLRASVSQDKYIYGKEREEPAKRPQKRKSFVYSPDVQLGKEGTVELKGGWKAELAMQRILYNQINHRSKQSNELLDEVRRIGGTYGAHDFFQKAEYNENTGLIESKVTGSNDQEISASFQPERFKMMLSFFNAGGQSSMYRSGGYVVPEANLTRSVRDALDIFKADQDASRERISSTYYEAYLEGRETSFGTRNAVDDILDSHGVLIKRQNGDVLSEADKDKLEKVVDETYKAIGNKNVLSKMAKENKLKVSYSGEKMAFLTKYVGLYVPVESTVVIGRQMDQVLPHEFAHFMDDNLGDQAKSGRGSYASEMQHTSVGKLTVLGRRTFSRDSKKTKQMGGYWNRSTEVFARMVEQYAAVNHYKDESYYGRDGYWTKEKYNQIKPEIEKVLTEKFGKSFMGLFSSK